MKSKEPSAFEMKMIRQEIEHKNRLVKLQNRLKLKWESNATSIIKEQINERIARKGNDDWKVGFYKSKLKAKSKIIIGLKKLVT